MDSFSRKLTSRELSFFSIQTTGEPSAFKTDSWRWLSLNWPPQKTCPAAPSLLHQAFIVLIPRDTANSTDIGPHLDLFLLAQTSFINSQATCLCSCAIKLFFFLKKKVSCRSPHGEPQPSWTLTVVQEKSWQAGIKFSNAGCLNSLSHASIYPDSLLPLNCYLLVLLQVTLKQHGVYLTSSHWSATNTMSQRKESSALSGFSTILGTQNQVLEKAKTALTLRILWRASTTAFKDCSDSCNRRVCCNRKRNLSEFLQHRNIQVQHYINESQY